MSLNFEYVLESKTYIYNHDDYCLYKLDKKTENAAYYHCVQIGCKARGLVFNDKIHQKGQPHSHEETHAFKFELDSAYHKMKRAVVLDPRKKIKDIYDEMQKTISFEICGHLQWAHIRYTLQRIRHSLLPPCKNLSDMINLFEAEEITKLFGKIRETEFYQGSLVDEHGTAVIFTNMELISRMPQQFNFFCDGTHSVAPFKASQLLIVMAEIASKPRPVCFVIMTSKKTGLYERVFSFLKDGVFSQDGIARRPVLAMTDFEKSMRNAFLKVWPTCELRGCFFHLSKALLSRANKPGPLANGIVSCFETRKCLNMLRRLCLVPLDRVEFAYEQLKERIGSLDHVAENFSVFLVYFENVWFKRYKPEEWVVGDIAIRSNNHIEGFNRSIKTRMPRNPSPYTFLDVILSLAYDSSAAYQSLMSRRSQPQADRSQVTVPFNNAITKLIDCEITELEFLEIMADQTFGADVV